MYEATEGGKRRIRRRSGLWTGTIRISTRGEGLVKEFSFGSLLIMKATRMQNAIIDRERIEQPRPTALLKTQQ